MNTPIYHQHCYTFQHAEPKKEPPKKAKLKKSTNVYVEQQKKS